MILKSKQTSFILSDCIFFFAAAEQHESKAKRDNDEKSADENDVNATNSAGDETIVDSSLPPVDKKKQRITEFQRMKANCKPDELEQLKTKCEILVRDCIAGLLVHMSNDDFKTMEGMTNMKRFFETLETLRTRFFCFRPDFQMN